MDYPLFDKEFKSGMPKFKSSFSLFNDNKEYLDYSSLFGKYNSNDCLINIGKLEGFIDLKDFIENNKDLKELLFIVDDAELKYSVFYGLISDFIGGYIYRYGTRYNKNNYDKLLFPIINYLFSKKVNLDIVIPILLLDFEIDSYKINSNIKIVKMSDAFQLSRTNVGAFNYSTKNIIEGCAKYALKIGNYYLEYPINNYFIISDSLKQYDSKTQYVINSFFISLFLETTIIQRICTNYLCSSKMVFFCSEGRFNQYSL